ncbi:MAG: FAD-binding oxidoreductase, partial [Bacteroidia bacterium]|nr:FAD-binding oxidoreductase [Bacteroidia bacterium]
LVQGHNYYVLIESLGSKQEKDREALEELLADALQSGMIEDAVLAHTESDLQWFWQIREDVHVLASQCQNDQHFDISLPTPDIGRVLEDIIIALYALPEVHLVTTFGHVADGNIHLIVGKTIQSEEIINRINDIIYTPLKALGGSVSAEHGIGLHKKKYLHLCRTPEEIGLMKLLKRSLDPKNILNPGKVL